MALRQTSGPFPKSTISKPHCWQQCSIWADPNCFLKADQREPSQSATLHSTASHRTADQFQQENPGPGAQKQAALSQFTLTFTKRAMSLARKSMGLQCQRAAAMPPWKQKIQNKEKLHLCMQKQSRQGWQSPVSTLQEASQTPRLARQAPEASMFWSGSRHSSYSSSCWPAARADLAPRRWLGCHRAHTRRQTAWSGPPRACLEER